MTLEELKRKVADVEIGWPLRAWEPVLTLERTTFSVGLVITWKNPDSTTGQPTMLTMQNAISMTDLHRFTDDMFEVWLRAILHKWMLHELGESIRIGGVLVWDPHANDVSL